MKKLFLVLIYATSISSSEAQLIITDTLTADEVVQEIFQGDGVSISNVSINGLPGTNTNTGLGVYSYEGVMPIPAQGIVICNLGLLSGSTPGSGNTDPDLEMLTPTNGDVIDATVLEFDFVPVEDTMIFEYVFSSSEYESYTCSYYNDVFGFFISGPGISGPFTNNATNIALLPNSQVPISINTVNSGVVSDWQNAENCDLADPNWQNNSIYFVENTDVEVLGSGMTVLLQAKSLLVPGQQYHIKLAIANGFSSTAQSSVYMEAGSFRTVAGLTTSLEHHDTHSFDLWVNDADDLVIDGREEYLFNISIFDARGSNIHKETMNSKGVSMVRVNSITPGMYYVRILSSAGTITRTFFKQ